MSLLTRRKPFKSAAMSPLADVDELLRGFDLRPVFRDLEPPPEIRIDVSESDVAYQVKADIPGVGKDDIAVSIDGNLVSIAAEVKRETESKDESRLCSERYVGRVSRAFTLPVDVDADKAEANYDNGVLSLKLPKKPNGKSRKISIS